MQNYLLLLRGDHSAWLAMNPDEIQASVAKYRSWGQKMSESGRLVGGNKLEDESGRVMVANGSGKARVTDGPYAETKDVIAGYYMVQAESFEDAVEIAQSCPHLQFGTIEVRRIEVVG